MAKAELTPAQRLALARHPERPGDGGSSSRICSPTFLSRGETACAPTTAASAAASPAFTAGA